MTEEKKCELDVNILQPLELPLDRMVEAVIVFGPTNQTYIKPGTSRALDIWCLMSDRKFGHCSTFVRSARADIFVELQSWHSALVLDLYTREFLEDWLHDEALTAALHVRWPINLRPWRPRLGMDCVTTAKHVLGVNAPLVFTPRQLYRYLVGRPGVTPLFKD